jgi:hypothetical protein
VGVEPRSRVILCRPATAEPQPPDSHRNEATVRCAGSQELRRVARGVLAATGASPSGRFVSSRTRFGSSWRRSTAGWPRRARGITSSPLSAASRCWCASWRCVPSAAATLSPLSAASRCWCASWRCVPSAAATLSPLSAASRCWLRLLEVRAQCSSNPLASLGSISVLVRLLEVRAQCSSNAPPALRPLCARPIATAPPRSLQTTVVGKRQKGGRQSARCDCGTSGQLSGFRRRREPNYQ